jgi:hypothetical protein
MVHSGFANGCLVTVESMAENNPSGLFCLSRRRRHRTDVSRQTQFFRRGSASASPRKSAGSNKAPESFGDSASISLFLIAGRWAPQNSTQWATALFLRMHSEPSQPVFIFMDQVIIAVMVSMGWNKLPFSV